MVALSRSIAQNKEDMDTRCPSVLTWVLVVALGFMGLAHPGLSAAQAASPSADGLGFVGSWQVEVTPPQGPSCPSLATFAADGTLVASNQPVQPSPGAPGEVVFASSAHGSWIATGPDTANFTFVVLLANGQGSLVGTVTTRATITLGTDGQTFSGEGVVTVVAPGGNTVATLHNTIQATRIVAEGRGTAGATR